MDLFSPKSGFLEKKQIGNIDLTDIFTEELELISDKCSAEDFKIFSSTADYNREFLSVFQTFKRSFVLDYNHKDGHFRV